MKKIALSLLVLLVIAGGILSFVHPTAFINYVSFKGKKQGQFKGESNDKSGREKDGWFNMRSYDMGGETPADAAQPAVQGKKQHKPFTITREVDAATPQLLQAMSSNEIFESVTIQTFDDQKPGKALILSNAVLISDRKFDPSDAHHTQTEVLSFNYTQITWRDN